MKKAKMSIHAIRLDVTWTLDGRVIAPQCHLLLRLYRYICAGKPKNSKPKRNKAQQSLTTEKITDAKAGFQNFLMNFQFLAKLFC